MKDNFLNISYYQLNMQMSSIFQSVFNIRLLLQDKDPIGIIPLENLCVREVQYTGKPVQYNLACFGLQRSAELPHKHYLLPHNLMNHTAAAK